MNFGRGTIYVDQAGVAVQEDTAGWRALHPEDCGPPTSNRGFRVANTYNLGTTRNHPLVQHAITRWYSQHKQI